MILVDLRSSFNSYESVKPCSFPDFKDFVKKLMEIVNFCLNTIEICLIEQLVIFIFWAHPVSFSCVNSYVYYFILFNFFRSKISCTIKWSMKYPFQRVQKPLPPKMAIIPLCSEPLIDFESGNTLGSVLISSFHPSSQLFHIHNVLDFPHFHPVSFMFSPWTAIKKILGRWNSLWISTKDRSVWTKFMWRNFSYPFSWKTSSGWNG